jgi:hypothetical protein
MHFATLLFLVAFAHWNSIKHPIIALQASLASLLITPFAPFIEEVNHQTGETVVKKKQPWFKIILLPLAVLFIFYIIFYNASDKFAWYSDTITGPIGDFLQSILGNFTLLAVLFFITGIILFAWLIFRKSLTDPTKNEARYSGMVAPLPSSGPEADMLNDSFSSGKLRREFLSSIVLLSLINVLVMIVNIIDVRFIWFGFEYKEGMNLSKFVHEGTWLLILSILLSMGILVYIFRSAQNFGPQRKILRLLSFFWLAQNAILAFSVAVRNYHYIYNFGLAYKRIGVCIFLLLVLAGLITFFLKIHKARSGSYLLKVNVWAVYVVLVISSLISWDTYITRHNTQKIAEPDYLFLTDMSDKALPLIDIQKLGTEPCDNPWKFTYQERCNSSLQKKYAIRVFEFLYQWETTTWLSWNIYDEQAYKNLTSNTQMMEQYKIFKEVKLSKEKKNELEKGNKALVVTDTGEKRIRTPQPFQNPFS